ncbi:MAG: ATP-binding cassette domain-containing protein [Cyclobacteriaceae bacterium]|nr:ATP-binding cassette domain-containing protein [Cyclobacteriaceae bacterium]
MSFSQEPVLQVTDASVFQENQSILSQINITVEKGEFVYLIGRTGSGKSSLLKTLYADLPLRLGDIQMSGYQIRGIKSREIPFLRRKIGIIFQDFELFYDRSIAENLEFVMRATGWKDKAKMKARMAEVLMNVGLGSVTNKMPHQLSGGEQQRVVIARALINEPHILLADEPTGNLDPTVSEGIFKLFLEINKSGTAILMATHNHHFIKKYPARILKCEDGRVLDSNKTRFELSSWY